MEQKANLSLIKTLNEIRILNLIREYGPISRSELAKRTRISKVAISDIINRLNETGFILEIGKGKSTHRGGKRPTMIKLNPENGFVLGIEIKRQFSQIAIADIEARIIEIERIEYPVGTPVGEAIDLILVAIDRVMEKLKIPAYKLISIGIAIPGFINYEKGELHFAATLHNWEDQPLAARFVEKFNVPTIVENDVNAITLAESSTAVGYKNSNTVCIWIGDGLGSGIIVDGQLVRGKNGSAGEIGYLELGYFIQQQDWLKGLYCGQTYFGDILTDSNLCRALMQTCQKCSDLAGQDKSLKALLKLADNGHQELYPVLDEYAELVAIICVHYIKSINPDMIILSGMIIDASHYLYERIHHRVDEMMQNICIQPTKITLGNLKNRACVQGSITLALQTIFEPPITHKRNRFQFIKNPL